MYFLVGKNEIRKLADYRYQTTEEVTPEPESGGEAATAALAASGETAAVTVWRQIVGDDMICSASGNFQVGDDTHAIILDKDYPVVSVGADEIAQLWTGENLNVGELGFYYNGDPAIGSVYGSLVGADMATMLDYKLRGVEYNPSIDGRIDFNSFLPVFAAIGTGDFALEIEVDIKTFSAAAVLRADGDTATARFEIAAAADGGLTVTQLLTGTEAGTLAATGQAVGVHAIKISRTAGAVTLQIDDTSQTWTGDAIDLSAATMAAPYSNANCVLRSVKLASGGVSKWAIDGVPLETPSQYTLPSQAHLNSLITLAGGSAIAGKELKSAGSISSGGAWADPPEGSEDAVGIDRFGFAMLPGGIRSTTFAGLGQLGFLGSPSGFYLRMEYGVSSALSNTNVSYWVSIRALKTRGELVLGGQRIPTVLIGLQSWTAENDRNTEFSTPRNDAALEAIYGPVYNYQQTLERDAALAASGSCWRVPRWDEYRILTDNATVDMLKSREGWEANSGKNTSGFNALPGGRTAASTYVGQQAMLGTVTPGSTANTWWALALTISNQTAALGTGGLVTGFSLRLVKRFYDVLMPWGEMLRFVKIGSLFIAQTNLTYRGQSGTLGRYYNNDSTLSYLGLLYTPAEAEILRKEFRDAGLPFDVPTNLVFVSTLATYNGGTVDTQGKKLKAATGWANPDHTGTDDYEFSALPGGERGGDGVFQSLGTLASFLARYGEGYTCDRMYGSNNRILGGWAVDADNAVAAAYIRLVYAVS